MVNSIGNIYSQYLDLKKAEQIEKTNRAKIRADTAVSLAELDFKKKIFVDYLEKSFDERKEIFKTLFENLDSALIRDDVKQMAILLSSITDLAKSSPFKGLMEIEIAMADKSKEIEL